MITAALFAVLVAMVLLLARAFMGPTIFDRLLAINNFGTKTVIVLALYGFMTERPEFLDIALVYALCNFIATIAVLKYFQYGDLGHAGKQAEDEVS
ncbi:MAG: monovalent cation/H+ antiporter complex subunit F [Acidiferrobacterales bacterium]|nr:monovalent cation/H+ antiporter complex subunit F [Acidiferrobacterales bacterium]